MTDEKKIDSLLVLEALQVEEAYREVRKRLAAHVLAYHNLDEGDEIALKTQSGVWIVQRATIGFAAKKHTTSGKELVARLALKPKGKPGVLEIYTTFEDVVRI